jgi:hypothetical protein
MNPMSLLTLPVESLREAQDQSESPSTRADRRERQLANLLTTVAVGLFAAVAVWAH